MTWSYAPEQGVRLMANIVLDEILRQSVGGNIEDSAEFLRREFAESRFTLERVVQYCHRPKNIKRFAPVVEALSTYWSNIDE